MSRSYIAFLSYRHKPLDMAIAKELHRSIERYVIPKDLSCNHPSRRLGYVFRDQDELPVSSDLSADIKEALDHSEYLIVVCTPDTPKSPWVNQEIDYFLKRHSVEKILAVLADGSPQESFPEAITKIRDNDGNIIRDIEPLAANVVSDSIHSAVKRIKEEKLRLLAALIGCSYDTLRQRERRYKRSRFLRITAICGIVILTFFGMLIHKNREISHQNDVLEEQNIALLKSESELLANTAAMQLEDGDYYNAIANAIQALPVDDDRPYIPNGTQILADALGVYDVGNSVVRGILKQDNNIYDVVFSDDEKYAFTIDHVGRITAFEIASCKQLWSVWIDANYEVYDPHIYYIPLNDSILVVHGNSVQALSAKDGIHLWSYLLTEVSSSVVLSNDRLMLAVLDTISYPEQLNSQGTSYTHDVSDPGIRFISTTDGKEIGNVYFDLETYPRFQSLNRYPSRKLSDLGIFTPDNAYFIGYYKTQESLTGSASRTYFSIDLQSMALEQFSTESIEGLFTDIVFGMSYDDENHTLLTLQRDQYNTLLVFKKVSIDNGNVIFEINIEMDDNWLWIDEEDNIGVIFKNERVYLYYGNKLCAFDANTGERRGMFEFDSNIVHITISNNNDQFIAVLTQDGNYTLHTVGKRVVDLTQLLGSIHFDQRIGIAYNLSSGYWDLIECDLEYGPEGKGVYIEVERNDSGLMAIIPADTPNQVLIERLNLPNETSPDSISTLATSEPSVDFSTLDCVEKIERSIPSQNIESVHLFDDANYLVLISNTDQLFIYDLQNGELVFSEQFVARYQDFLGNIYDDESCVVYDGEHHWLFVYSQNGHSDGILIDVDSWTRLATIPQMSGYIPESCEIVISKGGNDRNGSLTESGTYILPVYDATTLVDLGKAVIHE